jgi:hypothetical protein
MQMLGGKKVRKGFRNMQDARVENRSAVIIGIDMNQRLAEVIMQGSDEPVFARWPENLQVTPEWLKVGNAVMILSPGGSGRIEISGHSCLIPTTVAGGSVPMPIPSQGNGVISGCAVSATLPTPSMNVTVASGLIRISGTFYTIMAATLAIDAASSTDFRYDLVVAGTDAVCHIVKGTNSATNPAIPTLPADHVKLAHILVHPGAAAIDPNAINAYYTAPQASTMSIAFDTNPLHGHSTGNPHFDSNSTINVAVKDQYGNTIGKASPGHAITFQFVMGNGDLVCSGDSFNEGSGPQTFYSVGGTLTLIYTRRGTYSGSPPAYAADGESSPVFRVSTTTLFLIEQVSQMLQLLDDTDGVRI